MKKGIALALATMMVTSLAACGNTQDAVTSESTQPAGTETKTEQAKTDTEVPTVTMLTFTDWYKSGWEALSDYIDQNADDLGFRLKIDIIAGGGEGEELVRAKFATGDLPDLLQT